MVSENQLDTHEEIAEVAGLFELSERNYNDIQDMSTGDYNEAGKRLKIDSESTGFRPLIPQILESGHIEMQQLLDTVSVDRTFSYYGYKDTVSRLTEQKANDLKAEADKRAALFTALAFFALSIAIMAIWLVSRSITRPLRALTRQATDMANHRLPDAVLDILDTPLGDDVAVPGVEPITVHTRDEVADVADALNTVQDSALDLAVEQAVLRRNIADSFVNLGRRNQNLLGRQLDFITELEHRETDPDTLGNLFRLDHLATRMRRNAESLLVLAGIDPPRKWAAPVRVTDAIRAALGEVEDYQRVTVRAVEAATIIGSAAADLAHLLAELIENALIFSPPDQTVEIRGRSQPAGYTLAIIDSGLGMPPDELSRANRRLAGAESFTIAPSKYLGHYVAGNLAARHNINVTLHNSPGHGITATINLPPAVLTADAGQADTAPGAPSLSATPTLTARRDMAPQQAIADVRSPALPPAEEPFERRPEPAPAAAPVLKPLDPGPLTPLPPAPILSPATRQAPSPMDAPEPGFPPRPMQPAPSLQPPPPPPAPQPQPMPMQPTASSLPPLPATHDLHLDPLPPPVDPSGQHTQPMFAIDGQRQPDPGFAPLPPSRATEDLPQLSAPHLRVAPAQPPPPPTRSPQAPPAVPTPSFPAAGGTPLPAVPLTSRAGIRPADAGPDRTSGGLVKRSPRQAMAGGSGGGTTQPARPSDDLLQTLATYTTHLHRQINANRPPTPPGGAPTMFPAFNPTPPPGTPAVRAGGPGFPPQGAPPPHATPTTHASRGEHTASGLARRVAGAQMPQTQPTAIRNRQQPPPPAPIPDRRGGNDGRGAPRDVTSTDAKDGRSAKDVYSFLSSFSAGVQRGLDEARNPATSEEDQ
jgi:signal transduction histidine kinase